MARKGRELEELVATLEGFLSPMGVRVKSPDYLPDKDTGQLREVDISLRSVIGSSEILVIVECRDRQGEQDVIWVEQIAEKRKSVGADKAVVVSSSGFYEPAILKAKAKNIELRTFGEVDPKEIISWFKCTEGLIISLSYNIKNMLFILEDGTEIDAASMNKFDGNNPILYRNLDGSDRCINDVLRSVDRKVQDAIPIDGTKVIKSLDINFTNKEDRLKLVDHGTADIIRILIEAEIWANIKKVPLNYVKAYGSKEKALAHIAGSTIELGNEHCNLEFIRLHPSEKTLIRLKPQDHGESFSLNVRIIDMTETNK